MKAANAGLATALHHLGTSDSVMEWIVIMCVSIILSSSSVVMMLRCCDAVMVYSVMYDAVVWWCVALMMRCCHRSRSHHLHFPCRVYVYDWLWSWDQLWQSKGVFRKGSPKQTWPCQCPLPLRWWCDDGDCDHHVMTITPCSDGIMMDRWWSWVMEFVMW